MLQRWPARLDAAQVIQGARALLGAAGGRGAADQPAGGPQVAALVRLQRLQGCVLHVLTCAENCIFL